MLKTRDRLDIGTRLDGARDQLDRVIADVHLGIRDQRHYDAIEERVQAIARQLIDAVRR